MTAAVICNAAIPLREMRKLILEHLQVMVLSVDENDVGPGPGYFIVEVAVVGVKCRHCSVFPLINAAII